MKKTILIVATCWFMFSMLPGFAQTMSPKWGIETELVQPFLPNVGIIRLQATRTITSLTGTNRGDLLVGVYIRPNVRHDIVEKINEYMLMVGYRQFVWRGLHLEGKTNIGFSEGTKNRFDGKDYNHLSWFWEANAGYLFSLAGKGRSGLYLLPQAGVISSISSNIGPRGGESDTFPQASLIVGFQF
ncbi:hypothetical protein J2I47_11220 [Fibrella sp. HMF5335]|uniref:DUF3575 domain-containing protein n=1 Tax=Fibrella rubiginis TaxID=2817060 RepID=A0A939K1G2_9BACT|nr:hypothetical protein [Fibrella rubiginis]MBO0937117.1 hypothetical protein [Fibrella rubiginis]